jgi:hypothetical protein
LIPFSINKGVNQIEILLKINKLDRIFKHYNKEKEDFVERVDLNDMGQVL